MIVTVIVIEIESVLEIGIGIEIEIEIEIEIKIKDILLENMIGDHIVKNDILGKSVLNSNWFNCK